MSNQILKKILQNGENNSVEFKQSFQKEVIESIVAFANAKGGKIFIGVDDAGEIIGLESSTSGKAGGLNCEPLKAVIKP